MTIHTLTNRATLPQPAYVDRPSPPAGRPALRIVLVDDHAVMRDGLRSLLGRDPAVSVIGEAGDGHAAVQVCMQLRPDIVLMDLQLPSLDGIDAIATIRRRWPCTRVVVLSGMPSESRAAEALRAGAQAYVLKRSGVEQLMSALHAVRANRCYIDPAIRLSATGPTVIPCPVDTATQVAVAGLTPRERQVLKLIAEGLTNKRIAGRLSISLKTVETHRMNLMRKLDAHNAAELSTWARRLGLIDV